MVSIIVAVAENGVIGDKNTLLWHISEDLRNFKRVTSGHPVVMGRKTWESLGRPLPGRENVVVTRQKDLSIEGVRTVHSLEEAYALFPADEEIFLHFRSGIASNGGLCRANGSNGARSIPILLRLRYMNGRTDGR